MKKKKTFLKSKKLWIFSSAILASASAGIATTGIINSNKNITNVENRSKKINDNNLSLLRNDEKSPSYLNDGFISGIVNPNSSGELVFPSSKTVQVSNCYDMQGITPVPGGWILPVDGEGYGIATAFLDQNNNSFKWIDYRSDLYQADSIVIATQYDKATNKVATLRLVNNHELWLYMQDLETGNPVSWQLIYQDTGRDKNWFQDQLFDLVPVLNKTSTWVMMPRGVMNSANRFDSRSKVITYNNSNNEISYQSINNTTTDESYLYSIPSYGAAFNTSTGEIDIISVKWYVEGWTRRAYFDKMTIGANKSASIRMFESTTDLFTDSNKLRYVFSRLVLFQNSKPGSYATVFLYNKTPWMNEDQTGLYHSIYIDGNFNSNRWVNGTKFSEYISFQNSNFDVDIINPYVFDRRIYGTVTYFKNNRSGKYIDRPGFGAPYLWGAIEINCSLWNSDPQFNLESFANWDKDNPSISENRIKLFTTGIKKAIEENREQQFVIPSYNQKIWGTFQKNVGYYALSSALPFNQYTMETATKTGRYAYWTRGGSVPGAETTVINKGPNDTFTSFYFSARGDQSSKSAFDITTTEQLNSVGHYFYQHVNPISYSIMEIKNPNDNQDQLNNLPQGTKWSYFYYKGFVPAWVQIGNVFVAGVYYPGTININAMVGGFKQWTTSLNSNVFINAGTAGVNMYSATDLVNNVNNSQNIILDYLKTNINSYFKDIPRSGDFDINRDIRIEIANPDNNAKTANVIVHLSKWLDENHELQSSDKTWTIPIRGLRGPLTCQSRISWTDLVGGEAPTLAEVLTNNLNDQIKNGMANPVNGNFISNQAQLGLRPDEINITRLEKLGNNRSEVRVYFSVRGENLVTIITNLQVINTTLVNTINANKPNELPSIQTSNKLLEILNANKDTAFTNLPNGWEVNNANVQISNIRKNNEDGTVVATIKLLNVETDTGTLTQDVTFTNFKTQANTDYVPANSREIDVNSNVITTQFTEEQLKQYIVDHPEQFFVNYPEGLTVDDIALTDFNNQNVASGKITVNIQLKKYFDNTGLVENGTGLDPTLFTLTGFRTSGLTTSIASTVTFRPELTFRPSEWNANQEAIKDAIIKSRIVTNIQEGKTLTTANISLSNPTDINDATGTITLEVTIDETIAWENGIPKAKTQTVVMNGFAIQSPTEWAHEKNINDPASFGNTTSSNFGEQNIKDYINNHKDNFFFNAPSDTEVEVANIVPNIQAGSLTFELGLTKYYDAQGIPQNDPTGQQFKETFTLSGFKTDGLTTNIATPVTFDPKLSFKASEWENNQDEIKQKIVDSGIVTNLQTGQTLTTANISLANPTNINDATGTITLQVTIDQTVAWVNGQPQNVVQNVVMNGFSTQTQTQWVSPQTVTDNNEFGNFHANNYNQDKIKQYVLTHKNSFFTNAPGDEDVIISNLVPDVAAGSLAFDIGLTKYYDAQGIPQNDPTGERFKTTFTLFGFKTDGLTTLFDNADLAVDNVGNILPTAFQQDWNQPNNSAIVEAIKNSLIPRFTQVAIDQVVLIDDISFEIQSANNLDGTVMIVVTLSNGKYWENGMWWPNGSHKFTNQPVKLTGFKQVQPTQFANAEVTDPSFANIVATVDNYNKTQIKQFIEGHKDKFFTNGPEDLVSDDIVIIGEPQYQTAQGKIVFELGLKKWYDQNGRPQTSSDGSSFKQQFTLTGFNVPQTTTLATTNFPITGVSDVNVSSIANLNDNTNQYVIKIKEAIVAQIINANGDVLIDDIELIETIPNNLNGTIQAKVKLNNSKYWAGGVVQESHTFPDVITISGFKSNQPTQMAQNKNIQDNAAFGQIIASHYTEQEIKTYVWLHQAKFYTNAPTSLTEQDLVITNVNANNTVGTVEFTLGLKKYIDNQGNPQTSPDGTGCQATFILSTFKTSNITTTIQNNIQIPDVSTVNPNDINFNDQNDPNVQKIIEAIKNAISNPANPVENGDIVITNPTINSADGSINITVTLNNNKYQNEGVTKPSFTFPPITITGFKPIDVNNTTTLKKYQITTYEIGISNWEVDFDSNTVSVKVKDFINARIDDFFTNPANDTQVSAVSFGAIDQSGYIMATITFNGNNHGSVDSDMTAKLRVGKLRPNSDIPSVVNNQIRQEINNILNQDKDNSMSQDEILNKIKQKIVEILNASKHNLPNKLFDPNDITENDINLQGTYKDGVLNITSNVINRLGGITLVNGKFYKNNPLEYNNSGWLIWVLVGAIGAIMLLLLILIIVYRIKQNKVREDEWKY